MSSEKSFLALRLEGPLQSWGFDSQYNRRNTGLMPTKSAIAGMCCAALGYPRGSEREKTFLALFATLRMTAIAIPRNGIKKELPVRRLQDYHTVGGGYNPNDQNERGSITVSAENGKPRAKNGQSLAVLTHRQYLTDASFGVLLEGEIPLLKQITDALENPVWGVWLGRKACIPTAPVLAGLRNHHDEAMRLLIGEKSIESFTRQEEVENFVDGRDSLPDMPVSFASERRLFSPRRVRTRQAGEVV
ncbi:type I-E CRISPR-associated protein Cas5/CasD [Pelotalea chapellei]|uniref:Type I-E CRISPR-associated protein Cas5/CasD n=1 Tax=Pelotalea chapellei TaxID=44671 RepID=A0ABS5U512_9BACT|nr:type I-E CRISPR-associated protein Cas5/CasD [Pelotalea chapellei]MBT1070737.1 type I-E CRISPR-associated protein Cas5/CasD [Pelotalea chapellei]